jgi:hypothetical protein
MTANRGSGRDRPVNLDYESPKPAPAENHKIATTIRGVVFAAAAVICFATCFVLVSSGLFWGAIDGGLLFAALGVLFSWRGVAAFGKLGR